MELRRDSIYHLGVEESELTGVYNTMPHIYERFLSRHLDILEFPERRIVWITQPSFPSIKPDNYEGTEDHFRALIKEMERQGVPRNIVHIYKETLIVEEC